ncbi:MAG: hypothetical protein ACLQDV_24135 [Candidatus Binataceae bacterium]
MNSVIAGSDCGFSTFAGSVTVDPKITWAKLKAMAEGARIASRELWRKPTKAVASRKRPAAPRPTCPNRAPATPASDAEDRTS